MPDSIRLLSPEQVTAFVGQIRAVYREAFAQPPYGRGEAEADRFAATLLRHLGHDGFRCAVAIAERSDQIVGFVYGHSSRPGQLWHDLMAMSLGSKRTARWLASSFQGVEMAVLPQVQGRRLGSQLHECVLDGLPHRTAVLSTLQADTAALRLYHKRGWITLLENFIFPGNAQPYLVLGLDLSGRASAV